MTDTHLLISDNPDAHTLIAEAHRIRYSDILQIPSTRSYIRHILNNNGLPRDIIIDGTMDRETVQNTRHIVVDALRHRPIYPSDPRIVRVLVALDSINRLDTLALYGRITVSSGDPAPTRYPDDSMFGDQPTITTPDDLPLRLESTPAHTTLTVPTPSGAHTLNLDPHTARELWRALQLAHNNGYFK